MIEKHVLAAMLTRAFHEGFNVTREGFNGECSFDHLGPDGLTFEELSAITVSGMLADHDAEPAARAINGSCGTGNTVTLTAEEREAIREGADALYGDGYDAEAATLRKLLARLA